MTKKTLQSEANIIQRMEWYDKKPSFKKKYVNNRINSLAEVKRIYLFLMGNMRGYTAFEKLIKEKQPNATFNKSKTNSRHSIEWNLETQDVWEELLKHDKMSIVIKAMKIDSYEELCGRTQIY